MVQTSSDFSIQESGHKSQSAFNRRKTASVVRRRAILCQLFQMKSGWIPFVLRKAILRKNDIQRRHFCVAGDFRQNRRRANLATRLSPFTTAIDGTGSSDSDCRRSAHILAQYADQRQRAAWRAWWRAKYSAHQFHALPRVPDSSLTPFL